EYPARSTGVSPDYGTMVLPADSPLAHDGERIVKIFTRDVTADDVRRKRVIGNIPLHLACVAEVVLAIEFRGLAPRGTEYTTEDMVAAGAQLVPYGVIRLPNKHTLSSFLYSGGFTL